MKRCKKIAKIVNAIVCIVLLVFILMRMVYNGWSMYGHNWISFFSSLIILGGFIGMMYLIINWVLNKILKYKNK